MAGAGGPGGIWTAEVRNIGRMRRKKMTLQGAVCGGAGEVATKRKNERMIIVLGRVARDGCLFV